LILTISLVSAFSAPRSMVSAFSGPRSIRTKLSYSNNVDTQILWKLPHSNLISSLWSSIFFPSQPQTTCEQEGVDEYLEFLDRRYHRLRVDEDDPAPSTKRSFSAWGWLVDKNNGPHCLTHEMQQNDALHALGVAELASEKLLQKHHIPLNAVRPTTAATTTGGLFGNRKVNPTTMPFTNKQLKKYTSGLMQMRSLWKVPKLMLIFMAKKFYVWSTMLFLLVRFVYARALLPCFTRAKSFFLFFFLNSYTAR